VGVKIWFSNYTKEPKVPHLGFFLVMAFLVVVALVLCFA
jgi:hypothetical protein